MRRFQVEPSDSQRDNAYLQALAGRLDGVPGGYRTLGHQLLPRTIRLRPSSANRRVSELHLLFELEGRAGCTFGLRLGRGPAHTHDDAEGWAEGVAMGFDEALATKKRLPADCAAAADADGITWF